MSNLKLANNAVSRITSGIGTSDTSVSVTPGDGAKFPTITGAEYFPATFIRGSDGAVEIVKVTARATDTFTIVRAQESTAALALIAGDRIEVRLTAGTFTDEIARVDSTAASNQTAALAASAAASSAAATADGKAVAAQATADAAVPTNGDATINGVKTFSSSLVVPDPSLGGNPVNLNVVKWMSKGIGEFYIVDDSLTGVDIPPTNNPLFRYIKLTAGLTDAGEYNEGCLTSETMSGTAPHITATAVISLAASPMLGDTIPLMNTEGTFFRPSTTPGVLSEDTLASHIHTGTQRTNTVLGINATSGSSLNQYSVVPTTSTGSTGGSETAPRSRGVTIYMRIL